MKKIILLAFLLFLPVVCQAALGDVVINEIAWMGTTNSANDEWIELKNTTLAAIDLAGWKLQSEDKKIDVALKGSLEPGGFYLLERTDNNSVPNITADIIYKGALNNTGQHLLLYDASDAIMDQANFSLKWPAGDNTKKQTMEKIPGSWQTSALVNGTPRTENSIGKIASTPQAKEIALKNTNYSKGIIINEVLPAPEGPDDTDEWIELYNTNHFLVDISGWKLRDKEGTITNYIFPGNTIVPADGYFLAKRPATNITLNNDGDTISLVFPDGAIASSVTYPKAPSGQSYNNTDSNPPTEADWHWSSTPTGGAQNSIQDPNAKKILPNTTKTDNNKTSNQTASLASSLAPIIQDSLGINPLWLFLGVLGIIIFGIATILIINFVKKHERP